MLANKQQILNQSIHTLPFSEEFKLFAQKSGIKTVGEMTAIPVNEILKSEDFTYHVLQELVQFLEQRELGNLLRQ